jgi:hypothetical protein
MPRHGFAGARLRIALSQIIVLSLTLQGHASF